MKTKSSKRQTISQKSTRKKTLILSLASLVAVILAYTEGPALVNHASNGVMSWASSRFLSKFTIKKIEWQETGASNLSEKVPHDLLMKVSGLKIGDPLFSVNMNEIERRLMQIPYLESVQIQLKLNSGFAIQYKIFQARALGLKDRKVWLVATNGKWLAPIESGNWKYADLPFFDGFASSDQALTWLSNLENTLGNDLSQIHEVSVSTDRSQMRTIEAIVELRYSSQPTKVKVLVEDRDEALHEKSFTRLKQIVQYLIKNNILVSSIDLRAGQKVVVNVGKRL